MMVFRHSAATSGMRASDQSNSFLEVTAVGKTFSPDRKPVEAIRSVNLAVGRSEFVTLLGPSGCGKSTLLLMMAGLEVPTSGEIRIGGTRVTGPRADNGIVFQDHTLLPWKTIIDNVLLPIRILGLPTAKYRQRAEELLELVGLHEFRDKRPKQLSGGMKQRAAICRALVHDPQLLLMDEPFSALDAITRDEMNIILMDIWERYHTTVVFVTHSIREAVLLSDRVIVLGGRPATIAYELQVPFERPRSFALTETSEFNQLSGVLRSKIEQGIGRARDAHPPALARGAE
ncbi:MAG: transporter ATP-binding protein [Rhodospirillales bacterium]|nr:transporter ATP-binding protein [Rhodospirillales bacterium]